MTDCLEHALERRGLAHHNGLAVTRSAPLAPSTTLRIGGPAEVWARVSDERALSGLLAAAGELGLSWTMVGQGANLLIPDEGLQGVVCQLAGDFEKIRFEGSTVSAGGAVMLARLARETTRRGFCGLEALAGFPSTVGGAVVMNAGCYGTEIKDVLLGVRGFERDGGLVTLSVDELEAGYRTTVLQRRGTVITKATFALTDGEAESARQRMLELNRRRRESLPSGLPNAGSVFKNPPGDFAGRLLENSGVKGMRKGGARISEKHANVIVNEAQASAQDVLDLMVAAFLRVREHSGLSLSPELVLMGDLEKAWNERIAE